MTTAAELSALELPELSFTVDRLLAEGLALLVGKPKGGKSWLLLMLGIAVASGWPFLGHSTTQRDVLYLALEDGQRRMKSRLLKVLGGRHAPSRLTIVTVEDKWPRADQGGHQRILAWLTEHPGGMVMIDTLGRFRSLAANRGNAYMLDLAALEPLQGLAISQHVPIIAAHHDNKRLDAEDWVYSISGTQAIAGTADTLWGLARRVSSDVAMLRTYGRDTDESNLILRLKEGGDHNPFGWYAIGRSTSGAQLTPDRETVIRALDDRGSMSITDLAIAAGEEYETTQKHLKRMADLGLIRRDRGAYSLIPNSMSGMSDTSSQPPDKPDKPDKPDTRDIQDTPDKGEEVIGEKSSQPTLLELIQADLARRRKASAN